MRALKFLMYASQSVCIWQLPESVHISTLRNRAGICVNASVVVYLQSI